MGCAMGWRVPGSFGSCTIGRCGLRPPGLTFGVGLTTGGRTGLFGVLGGKTGAGVGGMRKNPLSKTHASKSIPVNPMRSHSLRERSR